jgi:virulence factor Mce-like protein
MAGLRDRFAFRPGMYRERHVRNGVIALGLMAIFLFFIYSGGKIPFLPKDGYTVQARFATAANVSPGKTPVRIKGIKVGTVEKVERQEGGRGVLVTMRIDDDNLRLRPDASAHIYWRTLLGFQFYVQLEPGAEPGELDGAIPVAQTTVQTELDQVLQAVDPPSQAGIRTILRGFDQGFNPGSPAGRTVDALGPAMKQIAPGLEALRGKNPGDLTTTIRQASDLMAVLAENEVALGGLVNNADTTLGVTAARRADLGSILRDGPQTLDDTKATMIRLRTTLDTLDPIAEALRPGLRELDNASIAVRPALRALNPTLDDARPLLTRLRPALTRLGAASKAGVSFMTRITPSLDRANDSILPALEEKDPDIGIKYYEEIGPTFATVDSSAQQYDANGYIQRFHAIASGTRIFGSLPCTQNLAQMELNCDDVGVVLQELLGLPAPVKGAQAPKPERAATDGSVIDQILGAF